MASARLRNAFRYPDEDEDEPVELDEEQQEKLIADLQQQDASKTQLYTSIFTCIPAGAALFFVLSFITGTTARERLFAILSFSSLVATAYILYMVPVETQDKKGKKPVYMAELEKSPINQYLFYLDGALSGILLLSAAFSWSRGSQENAMQEALPAVIFALTMLVREQLRPLQWQELQHARYELKGA